jgi:hypothetical protein
MVTDLQKITLSIIGVLSFSLVKISNEYWTVFYCSVVSRFKKLGTLIGAIPLCFQ